MKCQANRMKGGHVWVIIKGPTESGPTPDFWKGNPWQRVECKNCGRQRIEQPPTTIEGKVKEESDG